MTVGTRLRYLRVALVLFGLIFVFAIYPLMMAIWPSGWRWSPNQPQYEQMILGVYASQSEIDAQLSISGAFENAQLDYGWLAGKNWTIDCHSRSACQKIQADLGGSITAPIGR